MCKVHAIAIQSFNSTKSYKRHIDWKMTCVKFFKHMFNYESSDMNKSQPKLAYVT